MKIQSNKSLKEYTTFGVDVSAKYFTKITKEDDIFALIETPQWYNSMHYIIGGGSNLLFTQDYDGLLVHNAIMGITITDETSNTINVRVGAGENWHDFVMWSVENGYWGIENLVLIPGTVGAAPVQNIGAYGVEVKDTIVSVEAIDIISGEKKNHTNSECEFEYRNSFFKENEGEYIVTYVNLELSKIPNPHLSYDAITESLEKNKIDEPTLKDIAETIIEIRKSKLPEIGEIGMAGSFFKNPIIKKSQMDVLLEKFPDMKYFELENSMVKISAGWIIEYLGYKGIRNGNVGTYEKHALVLVNHGDATGSEIWDFAQEIILKTKEVFDIELEPEVRVI